VLRERKKPLRFLQREKLKAELTIDAVEAAPSAIARSCVRTTRFDPKRFDASRTIAAISPAELCAWMTMSIKVKDVCKARKSVDLDFPAFFSKEHPAAVMAATLAKMAPPV
jgi:hypothetical protein